MDSIKELMSGGVRCRLFRVVSSRRSAVTLSEDARVEIEALSRGYGLDFFETIFEMCT